MNLTKTGTDEYAPRAPFSPGTPPDLNYRATETNELERLKLRGLMCLPPSKDELDRQRYWFAQLREIYETLNKNGAGLDTLSMGMSGDFEVAIEEGATLVRVGSSLFGSRPKPARE